MILRMVLSCIMLLPACVENQPPSMEPVSVAPDWISNLHCDDELLDSYINKEKINIQYDKELMITSTSVVDDPCRTAQDEVEAKGRGCDPGSLGKWTFWYLMSQAAGGIAPEQFIKSWVDTWTQKIVVNEQELGIREKASLLTATAWTQGGYQAKNAPLRLLAIVNRIDLAGLKFGNYVDAPFGELRMVYGILDGNTPLNATVSVEYRYPIGKYRSAAEWAAQWRALTGLSGEAYNSHLQSLTEEVVAMYKDVLDKNHKSALLQVRTNESAFSTTGTWDMREFSFKYNDKVTCAETKPENCNTLYPRELSQTPKLQYNNSAILKSWITANEDKILDQTHEVPKSFTFAGMTVPLLAGGLEARAIDSLWNFDDARSDYQTRHLFGFATCNGCHYLETSTKNMHIRPRNAGVAAELSSFISPSGDLKTPAQFFVDESFAFKRRGFNEPRRRACEYIRVLSGSMKRYSSLNNSVLLDL